MLLCAFTFCTFMGRWIRTSVGWLIQFSSFSKRLSFFSSFNFTSNLSSLCLKSLSLLSCPFFHLHEYIHVYLLGIIIIFTVCIFHPFCCSQLQFPILTCVHIQTCFKWNAISNCIGYAVCILLCLWDRGRNWIVGQGVYCEIDKTTS